MSALSGGSENDAGDGLGPLDERARDAAPADRDAAPALPSASSAVAMSVEQILARLTFLERPLPRTALEQAVARKSEITPRLLEILENTYLHAEELVENPDYFAHLYALFLLAEFREPMAYPAFIRLASLPERLVDALLGDSITEDLPGCLASVAHGDPLPALSLAADRSAFVYSRVAAMDALLVMVAAGELERLQAVGHFREALRRIRFEAEAGRPEPEGLYTLLAFAAFRLGPQELAEEIEALYRLNLVDDSFVDEEVFAAARRRGRDALDEELRRFYPPMTTAIDRLGRFACFAEDQPGDQEPEDLDDGEELNDLDFGGSAQEDESWWDAALLDEVILRAAPKVCRNDPCPCGSGKKHKKCCGKAGKE